MTEVTLVIERIRTWLSEAGEFLRNNLMTLLPVFFIAVILTIYVLFYFSSIDPGLQARSKLSVQVDDARKTVVSRKSGPDSPVGWQTRLIESRATLTATLGVFLTDAQVTRVLDALYQHARESGVKIIELQVPPTPTPLPTPMATQTRPAPIPTAVPQPGPGTPTLKPVTPLPSPTQLPLPTQPQPTQASSGNPLYYVTTIRLKAQGTQLQLVDYVSRLQESSAKNFVVNNLDIAGIEGTPTALLTMGISLFVSPSTPGETHTTTQPSAGPVISPAPTSIPATPIPPTHTSTPHLPTLTPTRTPTPTPQYIIYVVRAGDTLYSLSRRYGVSVEAIMTANQLTDSNIRIGQQLLIPPH